MSNQTQSSNVKRVYDLEERTAKFGENVIVFLKTIVMNDINKPIIIQTVRSTTSIGANYMEAVGIVLE